MPRKAKDNGAVAATSAAQQAEKARLAAFKAWGGTLDAQNDEGLTWGDVSSEYIYWLIKLVTTTGGNVTFGVSKAGDTLSVTIYYHPNRDPRYYSATEKGIEKFYSDVRTFAEKLELL